MPDEIEDEETEETPDLDSLIKQRFGETVLDLYQEKYQRNEFRRSALDILSELVGRRPRRRPDRF